MWKRIVAMALVLVMVMPVAACAIEPSAQEIVDGVIEALGEVTTYQFDMDMTMEMAGEAEGEAFEMTTVMGFSGVLDIEKRQMRADFSTRMTIPGEDEVDIETEMYLIDNMGYVMMDVPEMGATWMKSEVSEADWEEMGEQIDQTESQIELLRTAEVKVIGSETIGGIDCYLLQLTPDMAQLWQIVMQQQEIAGGGVPDIAGESIREMFRDFSVKQWVAKDTYFLAKAEIEMIVELTPGALGFPEEEGEMTMDINITLLAGDYNEAVSIILPSGAEKAIDVTGGGEEQAAAIGLASVQAAVTAMMVDNELWELPNPVTVATSDMSAFPDATSLVTVDKINDPDGNVYLAGDKDGYILYQHDIVGDAGQTSLVNYVATRYTMGTYTVDKDGTVTEVTTEDE